QLTPFTAVCLLSVSVVVDGGGKTGSASSKRTPSLFLGLISGCRSVWLALGVALVAAYGVGVVARQGFLLTTATVGWQAAYGVIVAFVGIGLAAMAQIGLWSELHKRIRSTL